MVGYLVMIDFEKIFDAVGVFLSPYYSPPDHRPFTYSKKEEQKVKELAVEAVGKNIEVDLDGELPKSNQIPNWLKHYHHHPKHMPFGIPKKEFKAEVKNIVAHALERTIGDIYASMLRDYVSCAEENYPFLSDWFMENKEKPFNFALLNGHITPSEFEMCVEMAMAELAEHIARMQKNRKPYSSSSN